MNTISIVGCIVGIISCVIGVSTFVSAQITKAKQDGMQIAKLDQCVKGIEEIKKTMSDKNHEVDTVLDKHSHDITELQTQMRSLWKQLNAKST